MNSVMRSVELCAGAGGLALATTRAGFRPVAMVESDPVACGTIADNVGRGGDWVRGWPSVSPADLRGFDFSAVPGPIDLLSGGPPCQPFSQAGKHLGIDDDRDLFDEVARAVRTLRPRAFLIENTKGLARTQFSRQLRYICLQLAFPELVRRPGEHWEQLLTRLERMERCQGKCDLQALRYDVSHAVLNAADYGVAQQRERLMIVGFRHPSRTPFEFPKPTHSLDALLHHQGVTGEYWARHGVAAADRPAPAPKLRFRAGRVAAGPAPVAAPWLTVRDAIGAMPDPAGGDWGGLLNHQFQPGARAYPKHTGSCLDFPAKVLKAGRHGVPGGENMLCRVDGSVRYFTIRECARLQTFPDDYAFSGTWTRMTRQLGNAVPVEMCRRVAAAVREHLDLIGT